jgi:hypothetical protein
MNTASNTHLRLTTQVGQDHAAEHLNPRTRERSGTPTRASLTYTGQADEHHRSDRSLLVKPGNFHRKAPTSVMPM